MENRKSNATNSDRFSLLEAVIATDSYRSGNFGNMIAFDSNRSEKLTIMITYNDVMFLSKVATSIYRFVCFCQYTCSGLAEVKASGSADKNLLILSVNFDGFVILLFSGLMISET